MFKLFLAAILAASMLTVASAEAQQRRTAAPPPVSSDPLRPFNFACDGPGMPRKSTAPGPCTCSVMPDVGKTCRQMNAILPMSPSGSARTPTTSAGPVTSPPASAGPATTPLNSQAANLQEVQEAERQAALTKPASMSSSAPPVSRPAPAPVAPLPQPAPQATAAPAQPTAAPAATGWAKSGMDKTMLASMFGTNVTDEMWNNNFQVSKVGLVRALSRITGTTVPARVSDFSQTVTSSTELNCTDELAKTLVFVSPSGAASKFEKCSGKLLSTNSIPFWDVETGRAVMPKDRILPD